MANGAGDAATIARTDPAAIHKFKLLEPGRGLVTEATEGLLLGAIYAGEAACRHLDAAHRSATERHRQETRTCHTRFRAR